MSLWLLSIVTLIYATIAVLEGARGNWAICVVFAGYALANIGLMPALAQQ